MVNRSAPAPLQHAGAVELVVEDVLVVDDVEVLEDVVGTLLDVDVLEVLDVDDVELVDVDEVEDVDVDDDEVLDVELVEVDEVDVVVVPATAHAPGGGASLRFMRTSSFFTSVPPNSAQ